MAKIPKYRGVDFVSFQVSRNIKKPRRNNNDLIPKDEDLQKEIDADLKKIDQEITMGINELAFRRAWWIAHHLVTMYVNASACIREALIDEVIWSLNNLKRETRRNK